MKRPNISIEEAKAYMAGSTASITNSINELVDSGKISRQEADKYLKVATAKFLESVYVIAIRGYYKNSMGVPGENDRGIYDDAIILVGPGYFKTYNGNTDPRKHGKGIGQLLPGLHFFKQGVHGYKSGPYKAFRTANHLEILPVIRDGQKGIKDGVTINLHKGGLFNTNSIACQTIYADQWMEFQKTAYQLMDQEGQRVLPYLLIEE